MIYSPNEFSYFAFFEADVPSTFVLVSLAVFPLACF